MSEPTDPKRMPLRGTFEETTTAKKGRAALEDSGAIDKTKAAIAEAKSRKERFDESHVGRMLERIKDGNAMLLAGGIAYFSLTSLAAAVVIGVTLSSFLVYNNEAWNDAFYGFIDDILPGIVGTGEDAVIDPSDIEPQGLTGVVGIVSFIILFNTASRYLRGNRIGVRVMLGNGSAAPAQGKLRDFAVLFALILLVVLGIGLQVLASRFATTVASWFAVEWISESVIRAPAIIIGGLLDAAFVGLLIVVLGGFRGSRQHLLWTLLAAAVAIGVLRQAVSLIIASVSSNPVLGSVAAIVTVMIFVDFIARIVLVGSAWLGTLPDSELGDHGSAPTQSLEAPPRRGKGSVTTTRATGRSHTSS
ncbi:YihY/virulence factor BrkB family protein [Demequina globuliformis]|uniref:YihY/virulence factor BrkB family protein n=1 Tax=Demequina globuliformis TaxID=676202 RepID=UPI0007863DC6|nr:YihY/virulence factor BrkB family protein [Demequina globuliformis]